MSKHYRYAIRASSSGWVFGESEDDAYELTVEGEEILEELALPTRREVCDRCRGEGKHDHPAFSNGISAEEFDEDPDFREDYMAGTYDVPCEECHGRNVVDVIDTERVPADAREALYRWWQEEASDRRAAEAERRMGA